MPELGLEIWGGVFKATGLEEIAWRVGVPGKEKRPQG